VSDWSRKYRAEAENPEVLRERQ